MMTWEENLKLSWEKAIYLHLLALAKTLPCVDLFQ